MLFISKIGLLAASTALPNKSDMQSCEKINILIISFHFFVFWMTTFIIRKLHQMFHLLLPFAPLPQQLTLSMK
jgi:hypothetical protein